MRKMVEKQFSGGDKEFLLEQGITMEDWLDKWGRKYGI